MTRSRGPRGFRQGPRLPGSEDMGRGAHGVGDWTRCRHPGGRWCCQVALIWSRFFSLGGKKSPQPPGRACRGGGAWDGEEKYSCQVVRVCSLLNLLHVCCWGGRLAKSAGKGEEAMDGVPAASVLPVPSRGSPTPPNVLVSKEEVCRARSRRHAVLEAKCRTAGSEWTKPMSRVFEGTGCGPGAGNISFLVLGLCFPRWHVNWIWEKEIWKRKKTLQWALASSSKVSGKGANLQKEQELASELVPVRRPDVEAAVVVSQCWRQADSCQGPGCLRQAAIQAIVT